MPRYENIFRQIGTHFINVRSVPEQHCIAQKNAHYSNAVERHFCWVIDLFHSLATDNFRLLIKVSLNPLPLCETIDLVTVVDDDASKSSILEARIDFEGRANRCLVWSLNGLFLTENENLAFRKVVKIPPFPPPFLRTLANCIKEKALENVHFFVCPSFQSEFYACPNFWQIIYKIVHSTVQIPSF